LTFGTLLSSQGSDALRTRRFRSARGNFTNVHLSIDSGNPVRHCCARWSKEAVRRTPGGVQLLVGDGPRGGSRFRGLVPPGRSLRQERS